MKTQPKKQPCQTFAILIQAESLNRKILQKCYARIKRAVDVEVKYLLGESDIKKDNTLFTQSYSDIWPIEARCAGCGAPARRNGRPLCGCVTQATYTPKTP